MKKRLILAALWLARTNWVIVSIAFVMAFVSVGWVAWALHGPTLATWLMRRPTIDMSASGQWGDTFGAFNALFGALGFTAVFATLLVQGAALKRQQDELHAQRFESTYFELIRLLRELREQVVFHHSKEYETQIGRKNGMQQHPFAISGALREVEFWLGLMEGGNVALLSAGDVGLTYKSNVHAHNEAALGPYFRVMYTILKRISVDRVLSKQEKTDYGNLLRAQLTSDDIALAGYNALSDVSGNFVDYLKEFKLLAHLPEGTRRDRFLLHLPEALARRND